MSGCGNGREPCPFRIAVRCPAGLERISVAGSPTGGSLVGPTRFSHPRSVASRTPLIRRGPRGLTNRPRKDPHASARACYRGLSVRGPGSAVHVDLLRRNLISRGI
ncbi:hypothetical protein B296_00042887 [Ensete ventricosum]|uniref:Uncharacterized protein n=1 Tax=Ensete ventricosum TaxID=4639 RepID=A0A426YGI7_ENSVE|nr:hypothetical protein B296_00042887 [Ensete ventricosum]